MNVADLFCGAGGFSSGFKRAGHDVLWGVDVDETAIQMYERNHDARAIHADLTEYTPSEFYSEHGLDAERIDCIIGGPPCQGFSKANVDRDTDDDRNNLVFVFSDHVGYVEPDVFLMENVKGIQQTHDMEVLFASLLDGFREHGYNVDWRVLNAADFGVPQTRERVFVQGCLDREPTWPDPTHAPPEELGADVDVPSRVMRDD